MLSAVVNYIVPTHNVSVAALDDNPIVGKPFRMECNVTVAKGIISSVDIIWTANGIVIQRANNASMDMNSEHSLYRDNYTIIPQLQSNNNTVYNCTAVINMRRIVEDSASVIIGNITLGT